MKNLYILISLLLLLSSARTHAQDCCNDDMQVTFCYTAESDHCQIDECPYTFDGRFMEGIFAKLASNANFGAGSISDCDISIRPLGQIMSVADIEARGCDIVYIGNYDSPSQASAVTQIDLDFLATVREWSMKCAKNLTILFQQESLQWNYQIEGENVNPNRPVSGVLNIFNGPFGVINQFSQGGTFQANFRSTPATGSTVLAQDALGRSTIVLDLETNDILLADVGIFCNTAGLVTLGAGINNENDRLACNTLALGCSIALFGNLTTQEIRICEASTYQLPDGELVSEPGIYSTELINAEGCDSIVITDLEVEIDPNDDFTYQGCEGDGFAVTVGGQVYDETNTQGTELLSSALGCDSTVNIRLTFLANSSSTYDTIVCDGEIVMVDNFNFAETIDTTVVIENTLGCDSTIFINIEVLPFPPYELENDITIRNNQPYQFENDIPSSYTINWSPSEDLSCSNCPSPLLTNTTDTPIYGLTLQADNGCIRQEVININYICEPYIANIINPQSNVGNDVLLPIVPCNLVNYTFQIYDRWGNKVFGTTDQNIGWDGRLHGKLLQPGVYVYRMQYQNNGVLEQHFGDVTVLY